MAVVQQAIITPARESAALFSALRSTFAAIRGLRGNGTGRPAARRRGRRRPLHRLNSRRPRDPVSSSRVYIAANGGVHCRETKPVSAGPFCLRNNLFYGTTQYSNFERGFAMRTQRTVGVALSMVLGLAASLSVTPAYAEDQASKSAAVAKELSQRLDQAKLQHIAARDPGGPHPVHRRDVLPGHADRGGLRQIFGAGAAQREADGQEVSGHLRRPEQRLRARQPDHHRGSAV